MVHTLLVCCYLFIDVGSYLLVEFNICITLQVMLLAFLLKGRYYFFFY